MMARMMDFVRPQRMDRPIESEVIRGVTCTRVNTPGGFTDKSLTMLDRCAAKGGLTVV